MSFGSPVQASMRIPLSTWNEKLTSESSRMTARERSMSRMLRSLMKKLNSVVHCFRVYRALIYFCSGSIRLIMCSAYLCLPEVNAMIS